MPGDVYGGADVGQHVIQAAAGGTQQQEVAVALLKRQLYGQHGVGIVLFAGRAQRGDIALHLARVGVEIAQHQMRPHAAAHGVLIAAVAGDYVIVGAQRGQMELGRSADDDAAVGLYVFRHGFGPPVSPQGRNTCPG